MRPEGRAGAGGGWLAGPAAEQWQEELGRKVRKEMGEPTSKARPATVRMPVLTEWNGKPLRCSKQRSDVTESCSQRHWEELCSSWALGARDSGLRLQTQESPLPTSLPRAADNPCSWALAPAPEAASPGTVRVWEGQQHREKDSRCWNAFSHPLPQRGTRTPARICPPRTTDTHTSVGEQTSGFYSNRAFNYQLCTPLSFYRILQGVRGALRFT